MNVLVFASRKGGAGKSTLAAHLAAQTAKPGRKTLLIDADPQGSLSLWHGLREPGDLTLKSTARNLAATLKAAKAEGVEWVIIDTPPQATGIVEEAVKAATLVVVPARPSLFDLAAVEDTIALAKRARRPYAVVMNGAPPKRGASEGAAVREIRETLTEKGVPVWAGQITHRGALSASLDSGRGVAESAGHTPAADEVAALWVAIQKSVKAINGAQKNVNAMHKAA
jgi:chromosome partitioning protein